MAPFEFERRHAFVQPAVIKDYSTPALEVRIRVAFHPVGVFDDAGKPDLTFLIVSWYPLRAPLRPL